MKLARIRGVTLIELIVIIVVIGLAVPALIANLADITWRSVQSENMGDAVSYARNLLEEIKSKGFVDREEPDELSLGPNIGEVYPNFNDVDDYNGYNDTPVTDFFRSAAVDYVNISASKWVISTVPGEFKRIKVFVSRSGRIPFNTTLETVVSAYDVF